VIDRATAAEAEARRSIEAAREAICAALGGPSYRVNESLWQALLIAEHRRALANSEISLGLYLAGEASFDRTHPLTA